MILGRCDDFRRDGDVRHTGPGPPPGRGPSSPPATPSPRWSFVLHVRRTTPVLQFQGRTGFTDPVGIRRNSRSCVRTLHPETVVGRGKPVVPRLRTRDPRPSVSLLLVELRGLGRGGRVDGLLLDGSQWLSSIGRTQGCGGSRYRLVEQTGVSLLEFSSRDQGRCRSGRGCTERTSTSRFRVRRHPVF